MMPVVLLAGILKLSADYVKPQEAIRCSSPPTGVEARVRQGKFLAKREKI